MKKVFSFLNSALKVAMGWGLCIVFFGCDNFLDGSDFKEKLNGDIEYARANNLEILVSPDEGTGSSIPQGKISAKQGYSFSVEFRENEAYYFKKWIAVSKENPEEEIEGVIFENPDSLNTDVKVTVNSGDIRILPLCAARLSVQGSPTPVFSASGVSRDRQILVQFQQSPAGENFVFSEDEIEPETETKTSLVSDENGNATEEIWAYIKNGETYFKNIKITDELGISLSGHFMQPKLNGNVLTIAVDRNNPFVLASGEKKNIYVTVSKDVYYVQDEYKITMPKDLVWSYVITDVTDEQASIKLSAGNGGTVKDVKEQYSIGETLPLEFTENSGWQFLKWEYDTDVVIVEDCTKPNTKATVIEKTDNASVIKAVCAERPKVNKFELEGKTVSRNSSIEIEFTQTLPQNEEGRALLNKINITSEGLSLKANFSEPFITGNTVTFVADKSNMINVQSGQSKTVTVSIPSDFYYKLNDGTKVYFGGNGAELSYKIDSTTVEKAQIVFSAESDSGTVSAGGNVTHTYSLGEVVSLSFKAASDWQFNGWKIYYADKNGGYIRDVDESELYVEDAEAVSTKLHVNSFSDDEEISAIVVHADSYLVPVVESVKINGTTGIYNVTDTSCDSKIYITFNKPIDTSTVTLLSSGSINITKSVSSSSHYEDYFTADWSSDKKQLVLIPKNTLAELVPEITDTFNFIITLNANKKEIKDSDGFSLVESDSINNSFAIPYTVNGVRECVQPEWYYQQNLYDNSSKSKTLTPLVFENWESVESCYENHHIKDSVYFEMTGYDTDSGLKALRVIETYYKSVSGADASGETIVKDYSASQYSEQYTELTDGTFVNRFTGTHNLQTVNDGVIKLDFQLLDNAGNESIKKTYYVIKDTVIDETIVKFDETKQNALTDLELRDGGIGLTVYNKVRKRNGDNDTVTLTLSSIPQDTFYGSYKTAYNITVKYGYTKEDITNEASKTTSSNSIKFTFTHNTRQVTFVKIIVSDAAGNTKELLRALPGQAVIASYDTYNDSLFNWDYCRLKFANETQYKTLCSYYGASSFITHSFYKNTTDGDTSWIKDVANCCPFVWSWDDQNNMYMMHSAKGKTFYVYGLVCFKYGDGITSGDTQAEYWYSSLSDDYVKIIMKTDEDYLFQSHSLVSGASTGLNSSYVIDYLNVTTEPVINSSCYKVVVSDDFISRIQSENNVDTTDITYSIIAKNSSGEKIESKDLTFYLPSPGKYELFLKAENSNRQSVTTSSYRYLKINGTGSNQEHYLNFTQDLTAPALNVGGDDSFYSYSPAYWYTYTYNYSAIVSDNGDAGLVTDSDGKVLLDYYFIPNSNSTLSVFARASLGQETYMYLHNTYTLEELEGQYSDLKKTIAIASDSKSLQIPFDGLAEGLYTICIVAKDNNGNYTVKCRTAFNKRLHETLVLSQLYSNTYSYFFRANKKFEVRWLENGVWTEKKQGTYDYTQGYDPQVEFNKGSLGNWWIKINACFENVRDAESVVCYVTDNGFYDVTYLNLGYYKQLWEEGAAVMDVSSKNIIPGMNGMQVLCAAPTLAHTMYCSRKLSDGTSSEDIATWENMAMETGIVEKSSNFTYGNDKYESVPPGYYYTTIVHFADGTTLMSEVKQKQ